MSANFTFCVTYLICLVFSGTFGLTFICFDASAPEGINVCKGTIFYDVAKITGKKTTPESIVQCKSIFLYELSTRIVTTKHINRLS